MNDNLLQLPQWTTGPRLLKLGESIDFHFVVPAGTEADNLAVYPRYLEQADPDCGFFAGGDLNWINGLEATILKLVFDRGHASATYQPSQPGNYLARWRAGGEFFYRYFSVIEDDWIVVRFSSFIELDPNPPLHAVGVPLDYRLPIERFDESDPLFQRFRDNHRYHGEAITAVLPDTPLSRSEAKMTQADRQLLYGQMLDRVRSLLPDANDARSARIEMWHDLDPGYVEALTNLGVNSHFGLRQANYKPWLGMPEFPYFASPIDCRKTNQGDEGSVVVHQWDFCGGFHFLGPVRYHYGVSENQWDVAIQCLLQGMEEAKNLAEMSGHPAFLVPLYDGVTKHYDVSNPLFKDGYEGETMLRFVDQYQKHFFFQFTKDYKLAFARSLDIADYYRRHFKVTPRTVFVSKTDHLLYDVWWQTKWTIDRQLVTRHRLPWLTRISTIMDERESDGQCKDPLSCEYLLLEDQAQQIRFERESPNPIWWFDYTDQQPGPLGSEISHVETPDVDIDPTKWSGDGGLPIRLKMQTRAHFKDYAIALWNVPKVLAEHPDRIETNAKEYVLAKNTDDEIHMVLFFDLEPNIEIMVQLKDG